MAKIPTYEEIAKKVAEKALDEFLYEGKSIREWIKIIASEDAISRQAVIDALNKTSGIRGDALKALYDLPPVTPRPKTGHWIFDEVLDRHYYCSECKSMGVDYWDYCPNCGAKMVEPQEGGVNE